MPGGKLGVAAENRDPLRYAQAKWPLAPLHEAPRAPTVNDRFYPLTTFWRVTNDSQDGSPEGELWYLSYFESTTGDAIWLMLASGSSGAAVKFETDDSGANYVLPDMVTGVVSIMGGAGITVTGTGPGNDITIALTGGGAAIDSIGVDFNTAPGTDPVVPNGAGNIDIIGNVVANATNANAPVATHSRAANAFNIDVQLSTAIAVPADSFDVGLASFNTAQFTVDANGWVSISGGSGAALQTVTGDDATAVGPDGSGNINFVGLAVANATNAKPLYFNGDAGTNTETAEIQVASARTGAPGDKNDAGICSFDDTAFSVDTDGYVTLVNQPSFNWVEETGATRNLQVQQGVVGNRATAQTFTLPTTAVLGQKLCIVQKGAGNITIAQNASQTIHWLDIDTTTGVGGSMTTTLQWSSVCLLCVTADTDWMVTDNEGNWDLV